MADDPPAPEPGPAPDAEMATDRQPPPAADPLLPTVAPPAPETGYTPSGVPTLEGVRDKIETRLGTALGATELAEDTPEARTAAERYESRQQAAAEKLEEIRASMNKPD